MKYDRSNPIIRLQLYWQLYQNKEKYTYNNDDEYDLSFDLSIREIAHQLDYPLELVRRDFADLYSIRAASQEHLVEPADELIATWDDSDNTYASFINGKYDNLKLYLSHGCLDSIRIFLSDEEYTALQYISSQVKSSEGRTIPFIIKESFRYHQLDEDLWYNLGALQDAIREKTCVFFTVQEGTNPLRSENFRPLYIAYDTTQNLYAVLGMNETEPKVYRLHEIKGTIYSGKKDIPLPKENYFSHAPKVWGLDFFDKNPQKVKVRFYDEANVLFKAKGELENRLKPIKIGNKTYTGKLYTQKVGDHNCLYYEDIVYGLNTFKAWITGFGSSAIVEEPQSLREEIIQSLKSLQERL